MAGRFEELEAALTAGASMAVVSEAHAAAVAAMSMHDALELLPLRMGPFAETLAMVPLPKMGRLAALSFLSGKTGRPLGYRKATRALLEIGPGGSAERSTKDFLVIFQDTARGSGGLSFDLVSLMRASFEEMIDNAVEHGASSYYPVAAYDCLGVGEGNGNGRRGISFSVTDAGVGVLERLRQSPTYSHVKHGVEALELAVRDGVSSRLNGGGYGFKPVFDAVAFRGGRLRVRSSTGEVIAVARPLQAIRTEPTSFPERRGLHVRVDFTIHR